MQLGIDFGTTRTVVASADRGNYPILAFESPDGGHYEWFPSLAAVRGDERCYGWEAWERQQDPEWTIIRSIKRVLEEAGPHTAIEVDGSTVPLMQLLYEMAARLRSCLPAGQLSTMLGVPANANSNQRFLTAEMFRMAGFDVIGLLNEPSAASIEYGHRNRTEGSILVYDFGGGTFDVSLVEIGEKAHRVIATESIPTLGGDDFDLALAELAVDDQLRNELTQGELFRLHEECRVRKEAIHPNTRKLVLDLDNVREGMGAVSVSIADFYERCRPMLDETVRVVEDMLSGHPVELDTLYVTGGGSELPLVNRVLKESFGRRVRRSMHARSATAIGLAIQADSAAGYVLSERFTRNFGVWREGDGGRRVIFDPLFAKGTPLAAPGEKPIEIRRSYKPVHNIGDFRYLECSHLDEDGQPTGDVTIWDEIRFPFDPALHSMNGGIAAAQVLHSPIAPSQMIEELYTCDASGTVTVTITNLTSGYVRNYRLGRWAAKAATITPVKRRRTKAPTSKKASAE
ncbi:MAG: Hsp70 family protein [Acidobacteriaceae bacterium]|nr:Hsp70 family protein [Acidobacteriaceae bacterium]